MWFLFPIIVLQFSICLIADACPSGPFDCPDVPKHYEELTMCKPVYDQVTGCVSRFKCPSCAKFPDIEVERTGPDCRLVKCAGPPSQDCVFHYENVNSCCATYICDKKEIEELPKCYLNGKEHSFGEKMEVEGQNCLRCNCDKSFDNTTIPEANPNCAKPNCHLQRSDFCKGCAPIYCGKTDCCPVDSRCYAPGDFVIPSTIKSKKQKKKCVFGSLKMTYGDRLNVIEDGKNVECVCKTPPYLTCIQKTGC